MTDPQLTSGGPLQLVERFAALVRRRFEDEQAIDDAHALRLARASAELEERRSENSRKFSARRAAAQQPETMQVEVLRQYDLERASVDERLRKASHKMRKRFRARLKAARVKRDKIVAGETARFAAQQATASERVSNEGELTALRRAAMAELALANDALLAARGLALPTQFESPVGETFDRDNHEIFASSMMRAETALAAMQSLGAVRLAGSRGLMLGFIALAIAGAIVAGAVWGFEAWAWIAGTAMLCGVTGSLIVNRAAAPLARKQTLLCYAQVRGALADAQTAAAGAFADAKSAAQQLTATVAEKRDRKLQKAEATRSKDALTTKATLERKLAANAQKVAARLERMESERDRAIAAAAGGLPQRLAELDQQEQSAWAALDAEHAQRVASSLAQREAELSEVEDDWRAALLRWESGLLMLEAGSQRAFPPWTQVDVAERSNSVCDGVRFGEYVFSAVDFLPAEFAAHPPAWATAATYAMPAILSFCERPALLLATPRARRKQAVDAAYNAMLRIVSALGRGEVRCAIIDPAGTTARFARLVEQFDAADAVFHVATTDWQIEQTLTEHAEYVERVRRSTGDIAAPHRVLVVLGLPSDRLTQNAEQLRQIVAQGACSGLTTIAIVDEQDALGTSLKVEPDIAEHSLEMKANEAGLFSLASARLSQVRVALDEPPTFDVVLRLLRREEAFGKNGRDDLSAFAAAVR